MARPRPRTASYNSRSDVENSPSLGITPLRPSPAPATIIQNLAASLIGNLQEDVRCACHIQKNLFSGDSQGKILKWAPVDASRITFMDGLGAPVNVVVSVNENKDIWAGLANGNITILSLETQSIRNQLIHAHDAAVNCIVAGGDDFLIKKWDLEGVELFAYNHHHGFIKDLLILRKDPLEVRLWGASSDTSISVTALQDNSVQHSLLSDVKMLNGHAKGVLALCLVGPDTIWSGCEDGTIHVWSSLGVLKKQMQAHKGPVGSFVVMGAHVWSGSGDHTVLVWESSSCQLLFSLGDHGGFVKAMVRVEYMCWVFASGRNIRIWCAQSVWDTYEREKDRLLKIVERLKESLEKADREKRALEGAGKNSNQELQQAQKQLNDERSNGASALENKNAELEKLKSELEQTGKELEAAKDNAVRNAGNLDEEIKLMLEKLSKLKAEKESGEKEAKSKIRGLEKDLEEVDEMHTKALRDVAGLSSRLTNVENDLATAQGDLENALKKEIDLLSEQNLDNQKASDLENSLKAANDRIQAVESQLSQSMKDKEEADRARITSQAGHVEELADLERKIKQLQGDLDKAHESANTNLTAKDAEIQKLQTDLKKKGKDLKKALKDTGDEKKRSARELEELKQIIEQMRKNQEDSSSAEASTSEKLASLALELQAAHDDLQRALIERDQSLEQRDSEMQKMGEDHVKRINDVQRVLKDLQVENEKLRDLAKESEKSAGASQDALKDELNKTRALLDEALKDRDEAVKNATGLRENLQELEKSIMQLKDSATATDASSAALCKENDDLLNDAASEIQKLKDELSKLSQSEASQASALEEIKKAGEKALNDFRDSEQKRASSEKRLEDEHMANSEEVAKLSDALNSLQEEKATLERLLDNASSEMEKLRVGKASQEDGTAQITQELNQLNKEKATLKDKLGQKAAELEKLVQYLNQLKDDSAMQEKKRLNLNQDVKELEAQKALLEGKLSAAVREVEDLRKMEDEMERLRSEIRQKQDEYRFAKESAMVAAADAARRVEDLQSKILKLEMKLEDAITRSQAKTSADDPVWARIRELESALMQAHMDYRLLNQEVRHMRERRGRHRTDQAATAGVRPLGHGDGLDVALKLMQPGFCIDYTNMKVSTVDNKRREGNQRTTVKNVEVHAQTSNPGTPRRIIPIRAPISHPETPQRIIPVRVSSPGPEMIEPMVTTRPHSKEKRKILPKPWTYESSKRSQSVGMMHASLYPRLPETSTNS